jgi:hypothetical protein
MSPAGRFVQQAAEPIGGKRTTYDLQGLNVVAETVARGVGNHRNISHNHGEEQ